MNFDQARKIYEDLLAKYQAGETSAEEYESAVNAIVISDPAGTHWQIGVKSGRWYRFDGRDWVEDMPPPQEAHEKPRWMESPEEPAAPAAAPQYVAAPPKPKTKWGMIFLVLGLVMIGLTATCCLVIIGYAYMSGWLPFF